MAGLLFGMHRNTDRHRKNTYRNRQNVRPGVNVYTLEKPEEKPEVNEVSGSMQSEVQERKIRAVSKEDFLLNQIDEFRDRARQLQTLLDSRESEAKELQTLVDERQEKADELGQILKERQEKADGITAEVEKQIDSLICKVTEKLDEIESSMKQEAENGKQVSEEKVKELKASLEQIDVQLITVKTELSDKVHSENVKCYRNISDLFKSMEEKIDHVTVIERKISTIKGFSITAMIISILNLFAIAGVLLFNFGVFK